jgi:hypothetical protein
MITVLNAFIQCVQKSLNQAGILGGAGKISSIAISGVV